MREPVMPGWAEEQTPTPFLYHKLNREQQSVNCRVWGVCWQKFIMNTSTNSIKSLFGIIYYAIIALFVIISIMAGLCCAQLLYPNERIGDYANVITAIVSLFAFIVAWTEYHSRLDSMKAQVFSEYNKRFSEDPYIVKVVKYLNYIDLDGTLNNPHQEIPSNYDVEMFMRFFEELELQIQYGRLNEKDVLDLFVYYAKIIDENEELRKHLGVTDYETNWRTYIKLMNRKKE